MAPPPKSKVAIQTATDLPKPASQPKLNMEKFKKYDTGMDTEEMPCAWFQALTTNTEEALSSAKQHTSAKHYSLQSCKLVSALLNSSR